MTGSGNSSDPYIITTETDLYNVRNDLNAYYELGNDVTLTSYNTGLGWLPIGTSTPYFTGHFDGKGYKIFNLFINRTSNYIGLFGIIHTNSVIKNVGLENCNINTTGNYAGAIAGYAYSSNIDNCYSTGSITGHNYVGGLIGNALINTEINNTYSECNIVGADYVGGLLGNLIDTLTNSYSVGTVTGTGLNVGGLIGGKLVESVITNSFWDTEISGISTSVAGTGKTTEELYDKDTFISWDFINDWNINDGNGYPYLRVFEPDSNRTDVVECYISIVDRECNLSIISRDLNIEVI